MCFDVFYFNFYFFRKLCLHKYREYFYISYYLIR